MPKPDNSLRNSRRRDFPDAVINFEKLPDVARINSRCLKILLCVSDTTFWRRRKAALIADPDSNGTWSVRYVRELLKCCEQEAA